MKRNKSISTCARSNETNRHDRPTTADPYTIGHSDGRPVQRLLPAYFFPPAGAVAPSPFRSTAHARCSHSYIYISIHACVYTGFTFACRSSLLRRRRHTRGVYASSLAREYNGRRRRRPPPTEKVALGRGGTPFEFTRHADHARPSAQSMRGLYDPGYIFHSPSIVFNTLFVGS